MLLRLSNLQILRALKKNEPVASTILSTPVVTILTLKDSGGIHRRLIGIPQSA